MSPGCVYLVGAGPGDPGLLTLRGRDLLSRAGVVVYDHLSAAVLLDHAPRGAERIYVGKEAGEHTFRQEEINALLVDKARQGMAVVRLKGGDPFVFGRGGEEALALGKAGVRFEVVPGVTAAIACAAYAGIPATHRGLSPVLTLVTGHEDPEKSEGVLDWKALAAIKGTLVFYMGVGNLPEIARKLLEEGRRPETPAAVVRWGTLPGQRTVTGTLADISGKVRRSGLTPPCIVVIGEVVSLREHLRWFENRPLFGRTVVVTRSSAQAGELAAMLAGLGAQVLPFPTIRFEPPDDEAPLRKAARNPSGFDWIVFTSANAVERFFEALGAEGLDSRSLSPCKICCTGPRTAENLAARGIKADLAPERYTSKALSDELIARENVAGKRFLLPRADIAGRHLPETLRTAGAIVTEVTAYRTLPGRPRQEVAAALCADRVDMVTFTSSSTARNFASIMRERTGSVPAAGIACASIGPETSKAAREEGLEVAIEAGEHTIPGLVEAILGFFRET